MNKIDEKMLTVQEIFSLLSIEIRSELAVNGEDSVSNHSALELIEKSLENYKNELYGK